MGASGSLDDGAEFVASTGAATPTMLWDENYAVWQHYDVSSQPTVVLLDASGNLIEFFGGTFNPDEVLARL